MEVVGAWLHAFDEDGVQSWVNWIYNNGVIDDWFWNGSSGRRDQRLNGRTNPLFATRPYATHHNDWLFIDPSGDPSSKGRLCAGLPNRDSICRYRWGSRPDQDGAEGDEKFFHCSHVSER
jgi:hypothetical protein